MEEILEEGIILGNMSNTYYYGIEKELEADLNEDEAMEQFQSSRTTQEEKNHITRFLKLPKALGRALRDGKTESLVYYSQSQLLTLNEYLTNLESIATQKKRIQQLKEQKLKYREINKAKELKERRLIKLRKRKPKKQRRWPRNFKQLRKL